MRLTLSSFPFNKLLKYFQLLFLIICFYSTAQSQCGERAAYIKTNTSGEPWGQPNNLDAMNASFGAGNWDPLFFETLDPSAVFNNDNYGTLFIEGSFTGALELKSFLGSYLPMIEAFVNAGGSLFLNAAPNEGGNINFGFGGITLVFQNFSDLTNCSVVSNNQHPIIQNGLSGITNYGGNSIGHAIICPPSMAPNVLLENVTNGDDILVEMTFGDGLVIFGALTTPNFHWINDSSCSRLSPPNGVEVNLLRSNTLNYLSEQNDQACTCPDLSTTRVAMAIRDNACDGTEGLITYGTCPDETELEYSTDGVVWSDTPDSI